MGGIGLMTPGLSKGIRYSYFLFAEAAGEIAGGPYFANMWWKYPR